MLRKRALYNDMSRYVCCAGYVRCSGNCGESRCPELCLATEVFLCFGNSVASTLFLLQDEFNIKTTQCDNNCIIIQPKIEMDKTDGKFGDHPVMAAPPFQQMSRLDQPLPPNVGYYPPPPPQYAQPYTYPPSSSTTTTTTTPPPPPPPPYGQPYEYHCISTLCQAILQLQIVALSTEVRIWILSVTVQRILEQECWKLWFTLSVRS
ncbi:hypothetical protein ZIOFF_057628 [Zingiber officinale]|uniref:Uncharacterized protein n=1 Tax=Zingiber officinale TaxID=94328 RepID=A0A8J5KIK8_ZINOF|nr:hypothetical protein ZIOFF_057628 [Zingiber officinale]